MDILTMGFYCGLSILYPYDPVYCPTDSCLGDCRGVYLYTSKSAPLPRNEKFCIAYDDSNRYEWLPRKALRQVHEDVKICYWEDRNLK